MNTITVYRTSWGQYVSVSKQPDDTLTGNLCDCTLTWDPNGLSPLHSDLDLSATEFPIEPVCTLVDEHYVVALAIDVKNNTAFYKLNENSQLLSTSVFEITQEYTPMKVRNSPHDHWYYRAGIKEKHGKMYTRYHELKPLSTWNYYEYFTQ